jgi:hypothetical protein
MSVKKSQTTYRIFYINQREIYEIYARKVYQSDLWGFIEVEELVFGERSQVVLDPAEDRLKSEFAGVSRVHIPLNAILRIDEVEKEGPVKIHDGKGEKVTPFPLTPPSPSSSKE